MSCMHITLLTINHYPNDANCSMFYVKAYYYSKDSQSYAISKYFENLKNKHNFDKNNILT